MGVTNDMSESTEENENLNTRKIDQFRFIVRSAEFINGGGIVVLLAAFTALTDKASANFFLIFLFGAGAFTIGLFFAVIANWLFTMNINNNIWNKKPYFWIFLSLHSPIIVVGAVLVSINSFLSQLVG